MLLHSESSLPSKSSMARSIRSRTLRGNCAICSWASVESSARQRMFYSLPRFRLPAFELRFAAANDLRFFGREHVVGVNQALWLQEHAVILLGERHKVALAHLELLENLAGDDDLAPLADPPDAFLWCRGLGAHAFRLSDYQKLSSPGFP